MKTYLMASVTITVLFLGHEGLAQPTGRRPAQPCNGQITVQVDVGCPNATLPPAPPAAQPPPTPSAIAGSPEVPTDMDAPAPTVRVAKKPAHKRYHVRFGMALDLFPFTIDLRLSDHVSLSTSFLFVMAGDDESQEVYAGLMGGLDYYFHGRTLTGLRMGGRLGLWVMGASGQWRDAFKLVIARAVIGYDWIFGKVFSLGLEGGLQYIHVADHDVSPNWRNLAFPHIKLTLGFIF
ncbi:MAG: hypothetical protein J7M25_04115 [Deltaproteobacteria bacterium]|nr:hypothetical protein [Deltaproteobacteria bacterium]